MPAECGAILLAGGHSERMGADKFLLPFHHTTLLEHLVGELRRLTPYVAVVAKQSERMPPMGVRIVMDRYEAECALSGIHAGLSESEHEVNIVLACDLPLFDDRAGAFLLDRVESYSIVVPQGPRGYESLCAVYSKKCLKTIEDMMGREDYAIQRLYEQLPTLVIPVDEVAAASHSHVFFNMNTPEEYQEALHLFNLLKKEKG
jgi:molybdopterin-guanine dinucleotide biosynthesis protein A